MGLSLWRSLRADVLQTIFILIFAPSFYRNVQELDTANCHMVQSTVLFNTT